MAEFKGFSEISLYYVDNYQLVEAMKKEQEAQSSSLFTYLENEVMKASWFDSERMKTVKSTNYIDIVVEGKDGVKACVLKIYLGPKDLSDTYLEYGRGFWSQLILPYEMKEIEPYRTRFMEKAKVSLTKNYSSEDYSKGRILISARRALELDRIPEMILKELEKLTEAIPLVEEALATRGQAATE